MPPIISLLCWSRQCQNIGWAESSTLHRLSTDALPGCRLHRRLVDPYPRLNTFPTLNQHKLLLFSIGWVGWSTILVRSRLAADVLWKTWLKLCFGGWGDLEKIWKSARRSRADFQIFSKSPHPPKHNLGAKFSKARQLRDDFSINTPTLHVHAQSHSDSINTYFLMATDVFMQSLL